MNDIVYVRTDKTRNLYYKNSVPKHLVVVEPDAKTMIEILNSRLVLALGEEVEWLNCAICFKLPQNPVFFPTAQGIKTLYEKSELNAWFLKRTNNKDDPTGLCENANINHYKTPTPQQLLDFVVKSSNIERSFFISDYPQAELEDHISDHEPLLSDETRSPTLSLPENPKSRPSRTKRFLQSFFCCLKGEASDEEEKNRTVYRH